MSDKTLDTLREHLFAALHGVRDGSLSLEQAKTISDLVQVGVNTAKVEVDFLRVTERRTSKFLGAAEEHPLLPNGIVGVRRHLLKDD